jgi:hypothetical protein
VKTVNQKDEIKAYLSTGKWVSALIAVALVAGYLIARAT